MSATTPHSCGEGNNGFYSYCNTGGDCWGGGINTANGAVGPNDYGPGDSYVIDTTRDFRVTHKIGNDGTFSTSWSQDGKEVSMGADCNWGMQSALEEGMSFIVSTWSAYDADWLVNGKCTQEYCGL